MFKFHSFIYLFIYFIITSILYFFILTIVHTNNDKKIINERQYNYFQNDFFDEMKDNNAKIETNNANTNSFYSMLIESISCFKKKTKNI